MTEFKIYEAPTLKLLSPSLIEICDDSVNKFKSNNLFSADCSEIVGVLTGYETISTADDIGGYCDNWNKEIAINHSYMSTILHEVSHALQFKDGRSNLCIGLLSANVNYEQQCETMAKCIYDKLYPQNKMTDWSYFNKSDILFLKEWYGDWLEDDLL